MGIIRMIIVLLAVVIFLIVGIFVMLYQDLFLRGDRKKKDDLSMRFVRFGFRMVWFLSGCKAEIIGAENIPEDRAVLYIANHNSIFDIVLFGANVRSLTGIIAKVSLEKVPLLATWMRRIYCLFLDRSDVRKGLDIEVPLNYFPDDDPTQRPNLQWRSHSNNLYCNWINYYVYQATPYDLNEISEKGWTWKPQEK